MKLPLRVYWKHWCQVRNSEMWFVAKVIAFILVAYAFVGTLEYADLQKQEAERSKHSASKSEQLLIGCLNGVLVGWTEDKKHGIKCRVEEVRL